MFFFSLWCSSFFFVSCFFFFFFKQKTAYEMRISDWSSDVCSSDLRALAISQVHGIPELVARVLAGRGVGLDDAPEFLDPTIRRLMPEPFTLTDCEKAAGRIALAIRRREKVAIFGDYDVDGAASSALLHRFLRHFGIDAEIYIPDRIFEGYGPNPAAMRQLIANGARLIVTVDCGRAHV